jgi:L-seryl-tRNA(Ser) seleniumtransferase
MTDQSGALTRRDFLGVAAIAAALPAAGGEPPVRTGPDLENNVYTKLLGVRPHLGAHEHISRLGGGRMAPEVLQAMAEANEFFVDIHELTVAAGKRVAALVGAEAALVTSGGFSGLVLGAAACLTGTDEKKIAALPQPTWDRRECLIQSCQRFDYDRAYRVAGAAVVEGATREEMQAKLGTKTAFIAGLSNAERQGVFAPPLSARRAPPPDPRILKQEELIAMGKKAGVPVLIDMASDLPPWGSLRRFLDAGADLVVMSGGKVIGGPQSSGILAGRKDLIEAARLNATPFDNIGRGMKVGKEEVIGLVAALERFVRQDHQAETERWTARAERIVGRLQDVPGLTCRLDENTAGYFDADLTWDERQVRLTKDSLRAALIKGTPRVELEVIITKDRDTTTWHATARTRVLRDGEEVLVADRLRAVFLEAGRR